MDGAYPVSDKTLAKVGTGMSLHVLSYNLKRVITILGVENLVLAINNKAVAQVTLGRCFFSTTRRHESSYNRLKINAWKKPNRNLS